MPCKLWYRPDANMHKPNSKWPSCAAIPKNRWTAGKRVRAKVFLTLKGLWHRMTMGARVMVVGGV